MSEYRGVGAYTLYKAKILLGTHGRRGSVDLSMIERLEGGNGIERKGSVRTKEKRSF